MAILAYDDVMLREPRLLVRRTSPVGSVKLDTNHPLARRAKYCAILNGRGRYRAVTHAAMPGTGNRSGYFSGAGTTLTIPSDVAWVNDTSGSEYTIAWSEYVTSGQAAPNRGLWRIYNVGAGGSMYHIFGGDNATYRDFTVRAFGCINNAQNSPDQVVRHCAISSVRQTISVNLAAINGAAVTVGAAASLSAATNDTTLGVGYDYCTAYIGYFYVLHAALSQIELIELTRDPMQIWIPA